MRRADLLYCADIDVPRFKVLRARNQLPFLAEPSENDDERYVVYTLADAFMLRLMLDLIGGEGPRGHELAGVVPSYAVKIVSNVFQSPDAHEVPNRYAEGVWAGVAIFEERVAGAEPLRFGRWFLGDLTKLHEKLENWVEREGGAQPVRLMLANPARAAAFVVSRAKERGLSEGWEQL